MFVYVQPLVWWECAEVLLAEVTCIYLQGFPPSGSLRCINFCCGRQSDRAGENCNNFLRCFLSRLSAKSMMERWRETEDGGWRDGVTGQHC